MVNSTIFGKINKISFLLSAFPLIFCVRFLLKSYLCDEQQTNTESTHMNFSGIIRSIITVSDFAGCPFTLSFALFMKNSQFFNQKSYADNLEMCGICLNTHTHTHTHTHTFSSRVTLIYKKHLIYNRLANLFFPNYSAFLLRAPSLNTIPPPFAACQRKDIPVSAGDTR